jgi:hypothetical protein
MLGSFSEPEEGRCADDPAQHVASALTDRRAAHRAKRQRLAL